jgi:hypothetical protein
MPISVVTVQLNELFAANYHAAPIARQLTGICAVFPAIFTHL